MKNRVTHFLWKKINTVYYSGNSVCCPCCEWRGDEFLNARCPNCSSFARGRLLSFLLKSREFNSSRILHVAPNVSEKTFAAKNVKHETYDRVDIRDNRHCNLVQDITKEGLKKNYYTLVVIWHVLEHIVDDKKALTNLWESLAEGGKILVSVPIYPDNSLRTLENTEIKREDYEKIHGHPDHCRSCGLDYYRRMEDAGFHCDEVRVKNLNETEVNTFGLSRKHVAWIGTKAQ